MLSASPQPLRRALSRAWRWALVAALLWGCAGRLSDREPMDAGHPDGPWAEAVDLAPRGGEGGAAGGGDAGGGGEAGGGGAGEPDAGLPTDAYPDATLDPDAAPDAALDPDAAPDAALDPDPEPDPEPARCPPLAGDCAGALPGPVREHRAAPLDGCTFGLRLEGDVPAAQARAEALAARAGGLRTVFDLLGDLNREGRPGITAASAERLSNHAFVGARWNAGDEATAAWYPQGITGVDDAFPAGDPRRVFLVSWYDRAEAPPKGARISVVDLSRLAAPRYRHALLVETRATPAGVDLAPVLTGGGGSLHAGGVAWIHPWLYVADTTQGFRVFDLTRIVRITHVDDNARIGAGAGRVDAFGYRYAIPQVARYRPAAGGCPVRFSFVGVDRSADPPALVSGEYKTPDVDGRLVRWALDPATGWLAREAGVARGQAAFVGAQSRMQGGLMWAGDLYLSSSSQVNGQCRLYRTRPGLESRITAWPRGCEDLSLERATDHIWTVTEHPGQRELVGIPRRAP